MTLHSGVSISFSICTDTMIIPNDHSSTIFLDGNWHRHGGAIGCAGDGDLRYAMASLHSFYTDHTIRNLRQVASKQRSLILPACQSKKRIHVGVTRNRTVLLTATHSIEKVRGPISVHRRLINIIGRMRLQGGIETQIPPQRCRCACVVGYVWGTDNATSDTTRRCFRFSTCSSDFRVFDDGSTGKIEGVYADITPSPSPSPSYANIGLPYSHSHLETMRAPHLMACSTAWVLVPLSIDNTIFRR